MGTRNNLFLLLGFLSLVGIVISGLGIHNSIGAVRSMETVGVSAPATQGDLQYFMQESRRRFLYALSTPDPNLQLPYVNQARSADAKAQKQFQALMKMDLPRQAVHDAEEFQRNWVSYLEVRDEVISLILEGRNAEAIVMESKLGSICFEKASIALQAVRSNLSEHAKSHAALVKTTFRQVGIELALLLLTLGCLAWALLSSLRSERDNERENSEQLARTANLEAKRSLVLELTGRNEPIQVVLKAVCDLVQQQLPGVVAAVSVFHGEQLQEIVSVDLPGSFVESHFSSTSPLELGARWTCYRTREPVFCTFPDDAAWGVLCESANQHGFKSFWSHPVASDSGGFLGTLDVYFRITRQPQEMEMEMLRVAAQLATIAINHRSLYDELSFQAQRDALTELPNRRMLQDRLEKAIAVSERDGQKLAVLMIDLDRFKQVNDLLGHRAGDTLLRTIAQRLTQSLRDGDTVARVGGDEFTVVLCNLANGSEAEQQGELILEQMVKAVCLVDDRETHVSASIGISVYPADGTDPATLLRNADLALYQAKSRGRAGCQLYGPELGAVLLRRMSIEKGLTQAMQNGELQLHYQFKTNTGRSLVGMEALMRWISPELGFVSPVDFIPVAEETGMIVQIGEWALREACSQNAIWQEVGLCKVKIAVNISARQLSDPYFVQMVRDALETSGLAAEMLELELTETALMDNADKSISRLRELRDLGITIAIDDFGTGYSSLSYLQKLPVATVKIDKSFVQEITEDSSVTVPMIKAIIDMAQGMGLKVVAEGVETERQLHTLHVLGCDEVQGFLIQRPAQASEINLAFQTGTNSLLQLIVHVRQEGSTEDGAELGSGEIVADQATSAIL